MYENNYQQMQNHQEEINRLKSENATLSKRLAAIEERLGMTEM